MSHSIARTTGRARLARLLAALCVPGLLALAGGSTAAADAASPGPVSSAAYSAAVSFTDLEYPVPFYSRLSRPNRVGAFWKIETLGVDFFGEVATDEREDGLDLSFAVEGQPDPSGYEFCRRPGTCTDVAVAVTPEGLLYLYLKQSPDPYRSLYVGDFPSLPVELSASEAGTGLKVYREVMVGPPPAVSGCEDYGDNTPEAYTCVFLRELLPAEPVTGVDEAGLRAGLPDLVQPDDNYSLVFSEEFDGTPTTEAGCSSGLHSLDDALWSHFYPCRNVDSRGDPCLDVVDGAIVIGNAGRCQALATTRGKVQAKYGYWELKYTFNIDHWRGVFTNYNVILLSNSESLRYHLDRYGVEIQDWEDYLMNLDIEIDIVEYVPNGKEDVAHQYGNWNSEYTHGGLAPLRTNKRIYYCRQRSNSIIPGLNGCSDSQTFTVTRGIEWTPAGYRTFVKVDGIQDDLTLVPKDKIEVQIVRNGNTRTLTGAAKDRYFDYVDPDDTDTLLEQVAVSHVPHPISVNAWGYSNTSDHPYIRTRMKIDYIRLWQPENLYTDMEPVYQ